MKNDNIKYLAEVLDPRNGGWLKVSVQSEGEVLIPYSTRVKVLKKDRNFEIVQILEGYYKGRMAYFPYSSKDGKSVSSRLGEDILLNRKLDLEISNKTLFLEDAGLNIGVEIDEKRLENGKYLLQFPIKTLKKLNPEYLNEKSGGSRFAETWFPIAIQNTPFIDCYLHFGSYSEGCITIKYEKKNGPSEIWNLLYRDIITSRKTGNTLGILRLN